MTIQKIHNSFIVCGTYIEVTIQTQRKHKLEKTKLKLPKCEHSSKKKVTANIFA